MKSEIIDFVEKNSWFEWEEGNDEKDWNEAYRIKGLLGKKFPGILVDIDTCDEWVMLTIIEDEE
jgi:hypothetical protein